jgi:heme-degrading monooxygenase HmoA
MAHVLIRQKVQDYNTWKTNFDDGAEDHRKAAGSKGGYVFRDVDDPNVVSILLEWDNLENLNKFMGSLNSKEMQEMFKKSGVVGTPLAVHVFDSSEKTAL